MKPALLVKAVCLGGVRPGKKASVVRTYPLSALVDQDRLKKNHQDHGANSVVFFYSLVLTVPLPKKAHHEQKP